MNINKNTLLFVNFDIKFILLVLEIKARNIFKNINNPKNAVNKYLSVKSYEYICFIRDDFRKNIHINVENKPSINIWFIM